MNRGDLLIKAVTIIIVLLICAWVILYSVGIGR